MKASADRPPAAGWAPGDGLRLRYYTWGPSATPEPPVVLLHGITESAQSWSAVVAELAGTRRVIAFDARGHGESGWSADEAYASDHHFADLTVALDALGVPRCTLTGFSMGGAVATMYAAAHPERVAGLVIVDAYPAPELSPGSLRIAELLAALYRQGSGLPPGFDPVIARRLAEDLEAGAARRLDLWPLWESVPAPAIVVRGAHSDVLTEAVAHEMLRRQPRARLVTLAGAGHQIPSQRPRELAQAIVACGRRGPRCP